MTARQPRVLLVGGNDVDARLALMGQLREEFDLGAVGSEPALAGRFAAADFPYACYRLGQGRVSPLDDVRAVTKLWRIFREHRPDLVHAFDTKPGVWGCLAAHLAGVPVALATVTGLSFLYGSERLTTQLVWATYKRLQTLSCRLSHATVFQNREDARLFVEERMVSREKARIILGSGVATDVFDPARIPAAARARVRAELGIDPGELVVTMISRVIRTKGVLELAAAARAIGAERGDVRFLLIGPRETESMDRLSEAEVAELRRVLTWPGPRSDVPAVLAISDVVTLPTAYREGLPRVLLEAGAMGLPMVTTDTAGCNEVVEDGVNGFLVPPGDAPALTRALRRLIESPGLRRRFGERSRERILKHFDLTAIAAATRELYRGLLEAGRRA